jgi:hypothetical protein
MNNEFNKITTGKFVISIPKKYKIKKHNPYLMNKLFFLLFGRKIKKEFPGLTNYSPDLGCLKGFYSYEVKMDTHSFIFFTGTGDRKPEDMAEYIGLESQYQIAIKDIVLNNCRGKMFGDYSDEMTWIEWWVMKNDCMICFNIQGRGMPSQTVRDDIAKILSSIECLEN